MTAIAAKAQRFVTASTWKDYILSPLTNVTPPNADPAEFRWVMG